MAGGRRPRLISVVAVGGHLPSTVAAIAARLAKTGRDTGTVDGFTAVLGDAARLTKLGLSTGHLGDWAERLRQQGQFVMFLALDGQVAGLLGLDTAPRVGNGERT